MSDSNFHESDYAEIKAQFLAIEERVNNAESQYEMYCFATFTWPKFCKEMLRVILSLENAYSEQYEITSEAIKGIEDEEFLNS